MEQGAAANLTQKAAAREKGAKLEKKEDSGLYTGAKRIDASRDDGESEVYEGGSKKGKIPAGVKAAAPIFIVLGALFGIIALIIGLPVMILGAIDYNLQKALGFTDTVGILEEQGEYVTAELAKSGTFPTKYSADLAANGVDVGQVTASGDFYKTDTYIANIEEKEGLVAAASGFVYNSDEEGELALLYDGEVIRADDLVAKLESEPKLYAAYSKAANISARYYYGDDVDNVYKNMGLSRGSFNDWEKTGDYKVDEASFTEILDKVLDKDTTTLVGGARDDAEPTDILTYAVRGTWWTKIFGRGNDTDQDTGTFEEPLVNGTEASEMTSTVAEKTKDYIISWTKNDECKEPITDNKGNVTGERTFKCQTPDYKGDQTKRAAELLNSAVSAKEPYSAANTFLAIEEPIQRARIGDNGPVNELMNVISKPTAVKYEDIYEGKMVEKSMSILETVNFQAAVGEKPYSKEEAANFQRDRILYRTGQADTEVINETVVTTNGGKESESAVRNGKGDPADADTIALANESVNLAISQKNSSLFQSVIGANRVLEGGSFLSNNINMKVIGAMPSDSEKIAEYQKEADKMTARKAEAERATLSPFDISSPNTFLGSIVHSLATAVLGSYGSGASVLTSTMNVASNATGTAVANITGVASAEGAEQKFTTMTQDNCATIGTVAVEGDLYCTSHNTVATNHMSKTLAEWKGSEIGDSIDDEGKIVEGSDLDKFAIMGMNRESSVGVSSAEVCEAYTNMEGSIMDRLLAFFGEVVNLFGSCKGIDLEVSTGAMYTFSENQTENLDLYSGYMLHNQVYSLLTEQESAVSLATKRYYDKYPKDNSEAGVIARISGMSKAEAEIALAYGEYLNEIARYDSSDRYQFGINVFGQMSDKFNLEVHSEKMAGDYVAWYTKENEFSDLRTRNFVV